ncbi:hypothetical protein QQF64_017593 [Cirrhinus molitorella]|uniref:Uncharacterized protein n=2 Tax=Cirrhinus molitorella TaxID=172907 RepID=A0ABR3LKH4_9TELE|nr:hypothetical protein Q8A67_022672 [Cirrhinus molitorella]
MNISCNEKRGKKKDKEGCGQSNNPGDRQCSPLLITIHTHKAEPAASSTHTDRPTLSHSALVFIHCITCKNMADKPNMTEITSFDKTKLRKTETQEKNPLPTKETIEQERQGESTP